MRPSSLFTFLSFLKSHLFPTIILGILSTPFSSSCWTHAVMSSYDFLSLIEQHMMIPDAPLKYVSVRVLNFYCPAVSHSCSFSFFFVFLLLRGTTIIFDLKSRPMVGVWVCAYFYSTNLSKRLDFPTAELPIMTILARKSYYYFLRPVGLP